MRSCYKDLCFRSQQVNLAGVTAYYTSGLLSIPADLPMLSVLHLQHFLVSMAWHVTHVVKYYLLRPVKHLRL